MKKALLPFIYFGFVLNANAVDINLDKVRVNAGTRTTIVEADDTKSRVFGFTLNIDIEDRITDSVQFFFNTSINLETGANQTLGSVSEFQPEEELILNNGGVRYTPNKHFEFRAGALNQLEHNSPLLIGNNAFAGISQKYSSGSFYISATQAIPSNNRLTRRIGDLDDGNPLFNIQTIGFDFGSKLRLKANVSAFAFSDLSDNIAQTSRELGNSVEGNNASTRFLYNFSGLNSTFDFLHSMDNGFIYGISGQYLFNEQAPDDRNLGHLVAVRLGSLKYTALIETFSNGSDTSPAFYNSKFYGHNNMKG